MLYELRVMCSVPVPLLLLLTTLSSARTWGSYTADNAT